MSDIIGILMEIDHQVFNEFLKTVNATEQFTIEEKQNIKKVIDCAIFIAENLDMIIANFAKKIITDPYDTPIHLEHYKNAETARRLLSNYVLQIQNAIKDAKDWTEKFPPKEGFVDHTIAFATKLRYEQNGAHCLEGRTTSALQYITKVNSYEGRYVDIEFCIRSYIKTFIAEKNILIEGEKQLKLCPDSMLCDVITESQIIELYDGLKQKRKELSIAYGNLTKDLKNPESFCLPGCYDNQDIIMTPAVMDEILESIWHIEKPQIKFVPTKAIKDDYLNLLKKFIFLPESSKISRLLFQEIDFSEVKPEVLNYALTQDIYILGNNWTFLDALVKYGSNITLQSFLNVVDNKKLAKATRGSFAVLPNLIQYHSNENLLQFIYSTSNETIDIAAAEITLGRGILALLCKHSINDEIFLAILKRLDPKHILTEISSRDNGGQNTIFYHLVAIYSSSTILKLIDHVSPLLSKSSSKRALIAGEYSIWGVILLRHPASVLIKLINRLDRFILERDLKASCKTTRNNETIASNIFEAFIYYYPDQIDQIFTTIINKLDNNYEIIIEICEKHPTLFGNLLKHCKNEEIWKQFLNNVTSDNLLELFDISKLSSTQKSKLATVSLFEQPGTTVQLFLDQIKENAGELPTTFIDSLSIPQNDGSYPLTALANNKDLPLIFEKNPQIKQFFLDKLFDSFNGKSLLSRILVKQDTTSVKMVRDSLNNEQKQEFPAMLVEEVFTENKGWVTSLYILAKRHFSIFMSVIDFLGPELVSTLTRVIFDSETRKSTGFLVAIADNESNTDKNFPTLLNCINNTASDTIIAALNNNPDDLNHLILNTNDEVIIKLINKTNLQLLAVAKNSTPNLEALTKLCTVIANNSEKLQAIFNADKDTIIKNLKTLTAIIKNNKLTKDDPSLMVARALRTALLVPARGVELSAGAPPIGAEAVKVASAEDVARQWILSIGEDIKTKNKKPWKVGFFNRECRGDDNHIPVDKANLITQLIRAANIDRKLPPQERDAQIWQKTKSEIDTILIENYHNKKFVRSHDTQVFYDKLFEEKVLPQLVR